MSPEQPILRTIHLSRKVGDRLIVDDVSIDIMPGDVMAIIGPSGAGKSSFIRLLNRLDEPTGGTVTLEGRDCRSIPPPNLRRRVGMLMQQAYLFPGTVADNIRYGPAQRGETITHEAVEELLWSVKLPDFGSRDIANLSGGEAQRVSLARTLANAPEILLLDEPTSALDEAAQIDVEDLVRSIISDQKLTCLIVTHDSGQAARMANRAMVMQSGRLLRSAAVQEVLNAQPLL